MNVSKIYFFIDFSEINFDYDDQSLKYSRDKDLQDKPQNTNLVGNLNSNKNQINNNNKVNNFANSQNNRVSNNLHSQSKKDYLNNLNSHSQNTSNNLINQGNMTQNNQNSSANKNNSASNSNHSGSKMTFNNNATQHMARGNIPLFKPLSDSRLYEMANQYITTDESLEKFQARLKTKYGSLYSANGNFNSNLHVINETISPNNNNNYRENNNALISDISSNNYKESLNTNSNCKKNKRKDRLTKNIASNLEYYNMIES